MLNPTGVTIGAGKSVTQTFTVKVKDGAAPGTYYDTLEIYCGPNGNFISGPLAPVTIPGAGVPNVPPKSPVETPPVFTDPDLAATGGAPALAAVSLMVLAGAVGLRQLRAHGSS